MTDPRARSGVQRVATLSTGRVRIHPQHVRGTRLPSLTWILLSTRWGPWRPIHVFVIEHERGLVLFDTGQDRASLIEPDYYPASASCASCTVGSPASRSDPTRRSPRNLPTSATRPADVRWAVLSHLHQDHIGGLRELTQAPASS